MLERLHFILRVCVGKSTQDSDCIIIIITTIIIIIVVIIITVAVVLCCLVDGNGEHAGPWRSEKAHKGFEVGAGGGTETAFEGAEGTRKAREAVEEKTTMIDDNSTICTTAPDFSPPTTTTTRPSFFLISCT